jgi:HAD superfamily hydrolase (TIGR01509 family)
MWPPEHAPAALLLDLDGTLADSHAALRTCFDDFLRARDVAGTTESFASLDGAPLREIVGELRRRHGFADPVEVLLEEYRAALESSYARVRPATGAETLTRTARELGSVLVLVTSAPSRLAAAFLSASGLDEAFSAVVAGDRGPTKPDPAPYVEALRLVGVEASEALAFEDAPNGIRAAVAAGVETVGVAAAPERARELEAAGAVAVVATLADAEVALRPLLEEAAR